MIWSVFVMTTIIKNLFDGKKNTKVEKTIATLAINKKNHLQKYQ